MGQKMTWRVCSTHGKGPHLEGECLKCKGNPDCSFEEVIVALPKIEHELGHQLSLFPGDDKQGIDVFPTDNTASGRKVFLLP